MTAFGEAVLDRIKTYSREHGLAVDVGPPPPRVSPPPSAGPSRSAYAAFPLFRQGASVERVMRETGMARSTVVGYLCDFVRQERPASLRPWIDPGTYDRVAAAARQIGIGFLRPIYLALGEQVSYDDIKLVVANLQASGEV